jgi:hypothetical protein
MAVIPVVDRLARGADEGAGQARAAPAAITDHRPEKDTPAETTPQPKAHIGGNQVIGFNSSTTAEGAGSVIAVMVAPHEACPHVGLRGSKGHIASRSTPGGPAETMQEATSKCTLTPALDAPRRTISGRAGRLSYYVAGSGAPLLLIHSINAAGSAYEVKPIFEAMTQDRRVYAVDLPGFGFSDRSDRDYTPRLYTDAVHDMLGVIAEEDGDRSMRSRSRSARSFPRARQPRRLSASARSRSSRRPASASAQAISAARGRPARCLASMAS